MKRITFLAAILVLLYSNAIAQLLVDKKTYTRADTLRGMLSPLRTCYDINYYHLDVKINIENQSVSGSNEFAFTATQDFTRLQFDLFENLEISKVLYKGHAVPFTRELGAVFVTFPQVLKKGSKDRFTVFYGANQE